MVPPSILIGIVIKDYPLVNNLLDENKNTVVAKEATKEIFHHVISVEIVHEKTGNADLENVKKISIQRSIKSNFFPL